MLHLVGIINCSNTINTNIGTIGSFFRKGWGNFSGIWINITMLFHNGIYKKELWNNPVISNPNKWLTRILWPGLIITCLIIMYLIRGEKGEGRFTEDSGKQQKWQEKYKNVMKMWLTKKIWRNLIIKSKDALGRHSDVVFRSAESN